MLVYGLGFMVYGLGVGGLGDMIVGLLGLQGAFLDHIPHFRRLGAEHTIVRDIQGLKDIDRLVIPGGESTVMAKFLDEFGMTAPLRERIGAGMPVWGVCAGAILLAHEVDGSPGTLSAMPVGLTRNAYGRQIDSSQRWIDIPLFDAHSYPAIFIRAPKIDRIDARVTIHATLENDPIFVQNGRVMATTFHPELNQDDLFHKYFLGI
jgi:5'-phosphate synthase pdxT subunit